MACISCWTLASALVVGTFLASVVVKPAEGLSVKRTTYFDEECSSATGATTLSFGGFEEDADGNPLLVPFNECVVSSGAGSIEVCDIDTKQHGLIQYSDGQCSLESFDSTTAADCISSETGIDFECSGDNECAERTSCTTEEPMELIPNSFNVLAMEYNDVNCTEPTGNGTVVVSGDIFLEGPNDGSCYKLEAGSTHAHRRCLTTGSVISQTFASNDSTCSGQVYVEDTLAPVIQTCDPVQYGGLYYSYVSCTTDVATIGLAGITLSPAATPAPSATPPPVEYTPSPTPAPSSKDEGSAQDTGAGVSVLGARASVAGTAVASFVAAAAGVVLGL